MTANRKSAGERIYEAAKVCGVPEGLRSSELNAWPEKKIRWSIAGALPSVSDADLKACYEYAWNLWAAVCGIEPEYASNNKTAHVLLTSANLGGPYGVLADSYLAPENQKANDGFQAIQRYDTSEPWFAKVAAVPRNRISLPIVMCHELGHAIGLGHIADGNLLQPSYDPSLDRPQSGDIAEAVKRYGPPKESNKGKFNELWRKSFGSVGTLVIGWEDAA